MFDVFARGIKPAPERRHANPRTLATDVLLSKKAADLTRAEACIAHLIDLKRAGHTPEKTEYRIISTGKPVSVTAAFSSYFTSPAALCADSEFAEDDVPAATK